MPNTVTLTFAGETKPVEDSMAHVGTAADRMSDEVGSCVPPGVRGRRGSRGRAAQGR
jgi:hypothetical protein